MVPLSTSVNGLRATTYPLYDLQVAPQEAQKHLCMRRRLTLKSVNPRNPFNVSAGRLYQRMLVGKQAEDPPRVNKNNVIYPIKIAFSNILQLAEKGFPGVDGVQHHALETR